MANSLLRAVAIAVTLFLPQLSMADPLSAPTGDVILDVSGAVSETNVGAKAAFDLEMLQALGETSFETSTIWTEGLQSFTGVSLQALMRALGVEDGTLRASAINDYTVEIPVSDAVEGGPIVAYLRNGDPMSIRDKGPLWIVYPYDASTAYQTEEIYSRSIWQLDRLEVVE